ncbi:MAG: hypothetical protein A2900_05745 [Candidatus Chisholmbacteria bacterium RIFCSPLOWO2_01_FULL_50_28]|uniref:Uncharacterized protein n=1 Tax=Candidatus Chisholmbacteria bacterium RIFCSPHIGHO2_01_FULL_52_32 TaxID=1797591 RepID=A0A1G1VQG2_9BACT|nr:MAG: hypothetical protein A2786_05515 [Candidatus Chisholmbacteria bacterium RIFCSPHIGHO2_01_FULL_52_32]OGY20540.1 MAG: hypothetical protein A2900_05745 [Candidatus Chisholmbacteria bacterium RIFCSPLOWO2_01_FULL_50_28]
MAETKPGTSVAELSGKELREHLGRVIAEHPEAVRAVGVEATKAATAGKPEHVDDVLRGATGVEGAET